MYVIDRGRSSCVWRTDFCNRYCYNRRFYALNKYMIQSDDRYDNFWNNLVNMFELELNLLKSKPSFIRLCSRGEPFASLSDVIKVYWLVTKYSDITFWIPTRAWRNTAIRNELLRLKSIHNVRLLASLDPTNSEDEWCMLKEQGFSTMYFGDDNNVEGRYLCPKTHFKLKGVCTTCLNGCMNPNRVDIHMKKH